MRKRLRKRWQEMKMKERRRYDNESISSVSDGYFSILYNLNKGNVGR